MDETASSEGGIVQPRKRELLAAPEGADLSGPADDKASGWDCTKSTEAIGASLPLSYSAQQPITPS